MSWARIDDGFDDHPKVLALLDHDDGVAAIGLWVLCLTWAHRNTRKRGKIPGRLPSSLPRRYLGVLGRDAAKLLVDAGLWELADEGWQIHDFHVYLPTAETSDARSQAGKRGAAARWGKGKTAGRDSNLPSANGKPLADRMASDGDAITAGCEEMPAEAGEATLDRESADESSADGNLPFSDSNLPSTDGNAMATDGSRAPAHRAIPKGIAPVPTPVPDGGAGGDAAKAPPNKRGTRIPEDFRVTAEMVTWARQRCPHVDGRTETEKFYNHFSAKAGREALKLDWVKTWKNWMLTAEQQAPRTARASPGDGSSPVSHLEEWKRNRS